MEALYLRLFLPLFFLHLTQVKFKIIYFGFQPVFFQLHKHLLLQSGFEFVSIEVEFTLQIVLRLLASKCIGVQLFLLLLDPTMVDLLEIFLLAKLVVRRTSLLGYNARLIQLLLEDLEFIGQLCVLSVDGGDVWNLGQVQLALCFLLEPFLLEVFKSLFHAELDEEVA